MLHRPCRLAPASSLFLGVAQAAARKSFIGSPGLCARRRLASASRSSVRPNSVAPVGQTSAQAE
jgi:hypothetical protein